MSCDFQHGPAQRDLLQERAGIPGAAGAGQPQPGTQECRRTHRALALTARGKQFHAPLNLHLVWGTIHFPFKVNTICLGLRCVFGVTQPNLT